MHVWPEEEAGLAQGQTAILTLPYCLASTFSESSVNEGGKPACMCIVGRITSEMGLSHA